MRAWRLAAGGRGPLIDCVRHAYFRVEMVQADLLANHLGALAVAALDAQRAATADAGAASRVAALLTLHEFPGETVGGLASVLSLTHSACVRVVDALVADGLAERTRDPADARRVTLALSRAGSRAAARLQAARLRALAALVDPLAPGERAQLAALVAGMLLGEQRDRESARRVCRYCAHSICDGARCPVGRSVAAAC